jgi:hypothetical protein
MSSSTGERKSKDFFFLATKKDQGAGQVKKWFTLLKGGEFPSI